MENKNQPKKSFRAGTVSATIWEKLVVVDGNERIFNNIVIEGSYYDEEKKEWHKTNSFKVNELPKVELVTKKAYEYLVLKEEEKTSQE